MELDLGAIPLPGGGCRFRVWAPEASRVDVHVTEPVELTQTLVAEEHGYHAGVVAGVGPGSLYVYRLHRADGERERPDPASRHQPRGVHGPSAVVDLGGHAWRDRSWRGLAQERLVFYELHVGTFTAEGTFAAVIPHLDMLRDLGVTAIELMPVAQFPGERNWGYDGVYPYAVQASYGGPAGLMALVDACHERGLAVAVDVVYNHLGPEGNYLGDFAPYFSGRYRTPWGLAVNFDGPDSDEVRNFFIRNALFWVSEFHIDVLRVDAVHGIFDFSGSPFLGELVAAVKERATALGRTVQVVAESSLNDVRILRPAEAGGLGFDAQWNDDLHHALHCILTGETGGYYQDFARFCDLVKAYSEGFALTGQYSAFRRRRHGTSSHAIPADRFVVFSQNHDQVGNRRCGDRRSELVSFEALKVAAGTVILSPYIPLLFMGEEYGEKAPFPYFVSHSDPELVEAVRRGRREEFTAFAWEGEIPDPQAEETFRSARLDHGLRNRGWHATLFRFYTRCLRLRREIPALARLSKDEMVVVGDESTQVLQVERGRGPECEPALLLINFGREPAPAVLPPGPRAWTKQLDSAAADWAGPGSMVPEAGSAGDRITLSPESIVLFTG